jgi:hypothetical protein
MESGPRTYRLSASLEKIAGTVQEHGVAGVLVTTSDGKLFGLLKREDVERAVAS